MMPFLAYYRALVALFKFLTFDLFQRLRAGPALNCKTRTNSVTLVVNCISRVLRVAAARHGCLHQVHLQLGRGVRPQQKAEQFYQVGYIVKFLRQLDWKPFVVINQSNSVRSCMAAMWTPLCGRHHEDAVQPPAADQGRGGGAGAGGVLAQYM